jgi:hypothetical protein
MTFEDACQVAYALGRALDSDSAEFWYVVKELSKPFPEWSWHNLMTDGPASVSYEEMQHLLEKEKT